MPSKKETQGPAKEQQQAAGDEPDGSRQFARADHQARQDYQKDGEPFGPLDNRDLSEKEDVPSKGLRDPRDSEQSDAPAANAAESNDSPETRSDEEGTPLDEPESADDADGESVENDDADDASEDGESEGSDDAAGAGESESSSGEKS